MKKDTYLGYTETWVTRTYGNSFTTRLTLAFGEMHVDVYSACHLLYTGKQKILDTVSRVNRFEARHAKYNTVERAVAEKKAAEAKKAASETTAVK